MTAPRQVIAGRTYLATRRCTQRLLLLQPNSFITQAMLYCIGEAAERFNVTLHAFTVMSNHDHIVFRDNLGNMPEFLAHLRKMTAKVLNAYWRRRENLWASGQGSVVWLVNPEDCFDKIVYTLANPVASHLVDRCSDWPGASSLRMQLGGFTKTIARPKKFFAKNGKMPKEVTITVEPPAGFEHMGASQWRGSLFDAIREAEDKARSERIRLGKRVFGRKNVMRAPPEATPESLQSMRETRPTIACRDRARRRHELQALREFRIAYRIAMKRFRAGERGVAFPEGTYWMQRFKAHLVGPPAAMEGSTQSACM